MILVKVNDKLINLEHVQAIELIENTIELALEGNEYCYKATYGSDALAKDAFNGLLQELDKLTEGIILPGNYI